MESELKKGCRKTEAYCNGPRPHPQMEGEAGGQSKEVQMLKDLVQKKDKGIRNKAGVLILSSLEWEQRT